MLGSPPSIAVMTRRLRFASFASLLLAVGTGCGDGDGDSSGKAKEKPLDPIEGTSVVFELDADVTTPEAFYDLPYPSDLRLGAGGGPDLRGFPNPEGREILANLLTTAQDRPGFPVVPVAYFRFDGALPDLDVTETIASDASSPILMLDVDPGSPDRGTLYPAVATLPLVDQYTTENLLAVGPLPGIVLHPDRRYAVLVRRSLLDAAGQPLGVPKAVRELHHGRAPESAAGPAAGQLYEALSETLELIEIDPDDIAASTVFTTGDVVRATAELSDLVVDAHDVTIDSLAIDPADGASHARFCELLGTVDYPQFQRGEPPFSSEGLFEIGADGLPVEQRKETANVVLTLPNTPMPPDGYPLVIYVHGSGGVPSQVVDRGAALTPDGMPTVGEGPGYVLAEHGFAAVSTSMPVNPERLPGAGDLAYLNFANLAAFRDTFRQGLIEQRLLIEALGSLEIPASVVAGCSGPSLPAGASAYRLDIEPLLMTGQSMGGMYTNLVGATEPRVAAVAPTGAGGYWSYFIFGTRTVGSLPFLVGTLLGTDGEAMNQLHPALNVFQTAWEAAEPIVHVPRLAQRPLEGHPVRSIYAPAGFDDEFFQPQIYDAFAVAYGVEQAGTEIWPTMQQTLTDAGVGGLAGYPVKQNRTSRDDTPYTGAIVQYEGDGIFDPHYIFAQLDEVKYQYGCFFSTFSKTGVGVVPAPAPLGTPCPE